MHTPLAWIVGASSGIGAATARRLAGSGWRVAVTARRAERLEALCADHPERLFAWPGDVTDAQGLRELVRALETSLGPVDLCILNAGDYQPMRLDQFDVALFRQLMEVNYLGVVHALAAIMPAMRARGRGQILVTASLAGYRGLPGAAPYGATKAALISLAESLQPELAADGVALRLINPGFVRTALTDRNRFSMPFLMTSEQAADAVVRGLRHRRFEIRFPWRFAVIMSLLRCLPNGLYLRLTRRMVASS
ncbi:oxidoreductase [Thioalkalivibrio denitrificans]|uniref:Oxidoreductase n=1 Tax=Thioalkalivibrio denitrificans TaxID=108003 RepID=A0A1V3NM45_9GAMM|nr:SDR family NAD(P)-dependent oxidoreductase [Thioalkalivibrio denitrificans]OOG25922.1 oxidoreductase [Thioalkalivibrio denitrificans]